MAESYSKKDLNIYKEIMHTDHNIFLVYDKLFSIERDNLKDSVIYKNSVDHLKSLILREEYLYKELELNPRKITELLGRIVHEPNVEKSNPLKIELSSEFIAYRYLVEPHRLILTFQEAYRATIKHSIKDDRLEKANDLIDDDIEEGYLYYLTSQIKKTQDHSLKNNLIWCKYVLSYLSKNIEQLLINNNFSEIEDLYYGFPLLQLEYNKNDFNELINAYKIKYFSSAIDMMLVSQEDMQKVSNCAKRQLGSCLYQAAHGLIIDQLEQQATKKYLNNIIDVTNLLLGDQKNNLNESCEYAKNVINNADNSKIKYLSFLPLQ